MRSFFYRTSLRVLLLSAVASVGPTWSTTGEGGVKADFTQAGGPSKPIVTTVTDLVTSGPPSRPLAALSAPLMMVQTGSQVGRGEPRTVVPAGDRTSTLPGRDDPMPTVSSVSPTAVTLDDPLAAFKSQHAAMVSQPKASDLTAMSMTSASVAVSTKRSVGLCERLFSCFTTASNELVPLAQTFVDIAAIQMEDADLQRHVDKAADLVTKATRVVTNSDGTLNILDIENTVKATIQNAAMTRLLGNIKILTPETQKVASVLFSFMNVTDPRTVEVSSAFIKQDDPASSFIIGYNPKTYQLSLYPDENAGIPLSLYNLLPLFKLGISDAEKALINSIMTEYHTICGQRLKDEAAANGQRSQTDYLGALGDKSVIVQAYAQLMAKNPSAGLVKEVRNLRAALESLT